MGTNKQLIYKEDVLAMAWLDDECEVVTMGDIEDMQAVDAVPVDEIKFHHILIDENGIPEVKLQFGDRVLVLRREDDPVEVEHGYWKIDTSYMPFLSICSECGALYTIDGAFDWNYCPDCGAYMKGDKNG